MFPWVVLRFLLSNALSVPKKYSLTVILSQRKMNWRISKGKVRVSLFWVDTASWLNNFQFTQMNGEAVCRIKLQTRFTKTTVGYLLWATTLKIGCVLLSSQSSERHLVKLVQILLLCTFFYNWTNTFHQIDSHTSIIEAKQ